jgi:hypothetical protein
VRYRIGRSRQSAGRFAASGPYQGEFRMKSLTVILVLGLFVLAAATLASRAADEKKDVKKADARVFELRTYHAAPGKIKALEARFRDHTMKLFLTKAVV